MALSNKKEDFSASTYLDYLQIALDTDDEGLVEKYRGLYGLRIKNTDGKEGYWVIDTRQGKGKVEFNSTLKPQVTFIVKDEDILDLLTGGVSPQQAFFQGKVKVQGNMGMAMKLADLQRTALKKLEKLQAKL